MNNLVVVAHADDEVLNMGGTLHQWKDEYWKIVCVTKDIEHGRDPQFYEVCKMLGADGVILGYEMGLKKKWSNKNVAKDLESILNEREWDRVFTHNATGEYGHVQHIQLNKIMRAKEITEMIEFGYGSGDADWYVRLGQVDILFKNRLAGVYKKKTKAIKAYPFFDVNGEWFRRKY